MVNATPRTLYPQERDPVPTVLSGPQGQSVWVRKNWLIYANKVHNTYYITRYCDMLRRSNHCHGDSYRYSFIQLVPKLKSLSFRCDIPVVFYKLITKYNCQSKHNKNYCITFYNMFYNYMFRPFSLGHLQVVYTRP